MSQSARYTCRNVHLEGIPDQGDLIWEAVPAVALLDVSSGGQPFLATQLQILRDDAQRLLLLRFQGEDDEVHSAFKLLDEPLYRQDVFEVFLSEDGDLRAYKELEVSPWDIHFDGLIRYSQDGLRHLDVSWDIAGWKSLTTIRQDKQRIVSLWALPYSAFSSEPKPGSSWRFNAFRIDHSSRGVSLQAWQPTGEPNFHVPEHFGYLDFDA
ncbi:MAG: carbohydrate-binding family 9-like protein [Christensenellales bacterium]